ncbi:ATP-dependent DNA helicase PIF1 [Mytilus galloprovincialis]|uniref:ATP-dependent DNA helicase n=1 Tax=Mytilus galloprovincialis TaxID=29158 RepID=A0A8B6HBS1_MYTGA|nr:ATP-dependent DNA helicase PIF1 [Mytilus galloprovincialis]
MFETYEDFYKRGHVKFFNSNSVSAVKDTVDHNMSSYVKTPSSIDEAIKKLEENGSHEDAWAQLCSESESERVMCGIEGSENGNVNDDDEIIENNVPDLNREAEKEYSLPIRSTVFSNREIIPMLRSMNENQKHIFFDIRHWCLEKANGKHVDPFYVFITGGAGTGKSRLIKCLYFEISRILAPTLCNPDDVSVLLTAPTGTAAFNINGMTIHSCLSIFKSLSKDHATLSEDKLNTLRSKLDTLQVLIIDEISMVNKRLLYFVHERLRQIKKKPESCLFGGVSIIAVGDFYQLPPVKSKKSDKLYVNDPSNPLNYLWNELFKVAELHEIMRQKDDKTFAEMLNRLRIKKKNEIIELDDFTLLKHCMKEAPDRILHIFATNAEVQQFNNSMIMKYFSDPVLLEAEDYEKDKTTGTLKRKSSFYNSSDIQLPSSILLAVGARIMLIRNQDIKDGLVNGVMGTVQNIITACNHLPEIIYIQFDDDNVGKSAKEQKIISGKRCVGLVRCSEDLSFASGVRKQYPLKLAFACTAHKVQGLTVSEVAVDLSKCFTFGQSYVALSRVTSNKGLFISEMNNESLSAKIYADPDIEAGLASMKLFSMRTASAPVVNILKEHQMTIAYHNIQGLVPHISDLKVNSDMVRADFICLTETWLTSNDQNVKLDNYDFCHVCRNDAFNDDNEMFRTIKQMKNGGVGYFF